jgi:tRNA G10  N-methylase Trm11
MREYLKERLKKDKLKGMLKTSKRKDPYLSPTESKTVLKNGFEVVLFEKYVGIVDAVYDPADYKKRDSERPRQRPLHTISIRLAKILINLTGAKPGQKLLDPFCGIGVLLQEAMLMGLDVCGIDKSLKCVNDSLVNLRWVAKRYNLKTKFCVVKGDSRFVDKHVKKVDVVATEPYMGPFLKKLPTPENARKIVKELTLLYEMLLNSLGKVVRGKVAIVVPRFRLYDNRRIKINFNKLATNAGFKVVKGFPLTYVAVKSKIEREIWVLKK